MNGQHHSAMVTGEGFLMAQVLLTLPFIIILAVYCTALYTLKKKQQNWPLHRSIMFFTGVLCALVTVVGPFAHWAHSNFIIHMAGHLLLGMLAPLLMVLAAPLTLFLKALPVDSAKKITFILRSRPAGLLTHPVITSLLNVGGLWILYTTSLYSMMHEYVGLHIIIHFHVFVAGYLFTASLLYIDPTSHRKSYLYRSIILILALAGHGILSKYIYGHPPEGVPVSQAEAGGMLMYYGGDAIDLMIVFFLCLHWFRATRPRSSRSGGVETCQTV